MGSLLHFSAPQFLIYEMVVMKVPLSQALVIVNDGMFVEHSKNLVNVNDYIIFTLRGKSCISEMEPVRENSCERTHFILRLMINLLL